MWRIALAGIGRMGEAHLRAIGAANGVTLAGAADADVSRRAYVSDSVPVTADFRETFRTCGADAALLALPHDLHAPAIDAAFAAGLDVVKEKPLARTLDEARSFIAKARAAGRRLAVLGQAHHHPAFVELARRARKGDYGTPLLASAVNTFRWAPAFEGRMGWRADRERSGGVALLDAGWHGLAMLVAVLGRPRSVQCVMGAGGHAGIPADVDDRAVVVLEYASGAIATSTSSFVVEGREMKLTLHGTSASAEFDGVRLLEHLRGQTPREAAAGPPMGSPELLVAQMESVRDLLAGTDDVAWREELADALVVQEIVEAARKASATGGRVELGT